MEFLRRLSKFIIYAQGLTTESIDLVTDNTVSSYNDWMRNRTKETLLLELKERITVSEEDLSDGFRAYRAKMYIIPDYDAFKKEVEAVVEEAIKEGFEQATRMLGQG